MTSYRISFFIVLCLQASLAAAQSEQITVRLKATLSGEARATWEQENWQLNRPYSAAEDPPVVYVGKLKSQLDNGADRLSISPDGRMLLTARAKNPCSFFDRSEVMELWDIATGELKLTLEQMPHGSSRVYWSPHGKTIIVQGSGRTKSRLFDLATGRVKAKLPYGSCTGDSWFGYDDDCKRFVFNLDGSVFIKEKNPVKLWSARTGQLLAELKDARVPLVFSPTDKALFLTSSKDQKTALLWELVTK
jgi:WD40 repeat protein